MAFTNTKAQIAEYAKDKIWYWHIPLWLFGLLIFVKLLSFDLTKGLSAVVQVPYAFDFMLHELSHIFTAWLPPLMTAAAGSFSELLLGGLLVYGAFKFRNYFAVLFCCLWCMLTCQSVGSYMADAVPQQIPLVSLGGAFAGSDQAIHDWNFIFGQLHMLGVSSLIGNTIRGIGILIGLFGLLFSAWIMYKMAAVADSERKPMTREDLAQLKASAAAADPQNLQQPHPSVPVYPAATKDLFATHTPDRAQQKRDI